MQRVLTVATVSAVSVAKAQIKNRAFDHDCAAFLFCILTQLNKSSAARINAQYRSALLVHQARPD